MGNRTPRARDVLLAVALGMQRRTERRVLPDRRSGLDRRQASAGSVAEERRSGGDRRQVVRRQADREEGRTLLEKARTRMLRRPRGGSGEAGGDGLR
jgi:hypothetical protein